MRISILILGFKGLINWNEILHLSWLKSCLQTLAWTVKMATTVYQREISTGHLTDIWKDWGAYTGLVLLWALWIPWLSVNFSMTFSSPPWLKVICRFQKMFKAIPFTAFLAQLRSTSKLWYQLKYVPFALFLPEKSADAINGFPVRKWQEKRA